MRKKDVRKRGKKLVYKRYMGEFIDFKEEIKPYDSIEHELSNYINNFTMAGFPVRKEILIAEKLLDELEKEAICENVDLSTLISVYLLEQLERDKPTRVFAKGKTKGKVKYVLNNLYEHSDFIQYAENKEEFEENIFDKEFIKYRKLSYTSIHCDEEIYIKNFLLNRGYTLEQIHQIEKEEKEIQGIVKLEEGELMNPKILNMEMTFKEVPALNFEYVDYLFIPARLGIHYILLNKVDNFKNYKDIEAFIINKMKLYKNIWELYADCFKADIQQR